MAVTNYYKILELDRSADTEAISKAISTKRRFWQPKTSNPKLETRQLAEKMMKDISEAERILNNPSKRSNYDQQLSAQVVEPETVTPPRGGRDWLKIAIEYLSQGDATQANYAAREATVQQSENPEAWYYRGVSSALLDNDRDALFELTEAVRLNPNEAPYHAELGDLYRRNDQWRQGLDAYRRASKLDPDNPYFRAFAGLALSALDEHDKGVKLLRSAHEQMPQEELFREFLGLALVGQATATWSTYHDESKNILSEAQLTATKQKLAEIERLDIKDRDFANDVDELRVIAEEAETTKFQSFDGVAGLLGAQAVTFVVMLIGFSVGRGGAFIGLVALGLMVLWAYLFVQRRRMPGWQWNRKQSPAYVRGTGLQ